MCLTGLDFTFHEIHSDLLSTSSTEAEPSHSSQVLQSLTWMFLKSTVTLHRTHPFCGSLNGFSILASLRWRASDINTTCSGQPCKYWQTLLWWISIITYHVIFLLDCVWSGCQTSQTCRSTLALAMLAILSLPDNHDSNLYLKQVSIVNLNIVNFITHSNTC